jgi:alpha-tubulin suppressor-like RCC1 family protein
VQCWGVNPFGALGDGTTTAALAPTRIASLTSGVSAIAAGSFHTCALLSATGGVQCWGMSTSGQTGDGIMPQPGSWYQLNVPTHVSGLSSGVAAIGANNEHSCALLTTGAVKCWGSNGYGELGDGSTTSRAVPVSVPGLTATALAVGYDHTCAVTSPYGGAKCWGYNYYGQLGTGYPQYGETAPADVVGLTSGVAAIDAGSRHTCALLAATGGLKCWGSNSYGQLGDGTTTTRYGATNVLGLTSGVAAVATGAFHTCVLLTATGGVQCWGYNSNGQLGDGTIINRLTPTNVIGLSSGVAALAAGYAHTCVVMAAAGASGEQCWGSGGGRLGDGTTNSQTSPVNVAAFAT